MKRKRHNRRRGSMMLEVLIASMLAVMVIGLLVSVQTLTLRDFQRTLNENTADRNTYTALRQIRELIQNSVQATVAGNQLTLYSPRRNASGAIILPVEPDLDNPVTLQVNFATGTLTLNGTPLLTGIVNQRPSGGTYSPFQIQTLAPGVQVVHLRLAVRQGQGNTARTAWYEESVLLRNPATN